MAQSRLAIAAALSPKTQSSMCHWIEARRLAFSFLMISLMTAIGKADIAKRVKSKLVKLLRNLSVRSDNNSVREISQ
jgi:hypothetical protein